ncbi:MAG: hypothetical protein HQL26_03525 [Candidatus Omnitrophica bacterium]|nr:hypothetical protein [Candidatus Omnitrophota bacterium]
MDFTSKQFLLFILTFISGYYLCPAKIWKSWGISAFSLIFIFLIFPPAQSIYFFLFLILNYTAIKTMIKHPSGKLLFILIFSLVFLFGYLKKYSFLSFLPFINSPYQVLGLSYILFRCLHLLVDAKEGLLAGQKFSILDFFAYTCCPLSFISGPIQLYPEFKDQLSRPKKEIFFNLKIFDHVNRLMTGYLKIIALGPIFFYFHQTQLSAFLAHKSMVITFTETSFCYLFFLYFNFSGYMDIIISLGHLTGFAFPENLNHPFQSKGMLEFWNRWHITLSNWIKLYIFNPLMKGMMSKSSDPKLTPWYGIAAFFITFFAAGVWHGSTTAAMVYGILLGAGVSANKFYEVVLRARMNKSQFSAWHDHKAYASFMSGLTFSYMSICISCLFANFQQLRNFYETLSWTGILEVLLFGTIVWGSIKFIYQILFDHSLFWREKLAAFPFNKHISLALKLLFLGLILSMSAYEKPQFVYQLF